MKFFFYVLIASTLKKKVVPCNKFELSGFSFLSFCRSSGNSLVGLWSSQLVCIRNIFLSTRWQCPLWAGQPAHPHCRAGHRPSCVQCLTWAHSSSSSAHSLVFVNIWELHLSERLQLGQSVGPAVVREWIKGHSNREILISSETKVIDFFLLAGKIALFIFLYDSLTRLLW